MWNKQYSEIWYAAWRNHTIMKSPFAFKDYWNRWFSDNISHSSWSIVTYNKSLDTIQCRLWRLQNIDARCLCKLMHQKHVFLSIKWTFYFYFLYLRFTISPANLYLVTTKSSAMVFSIISASSDAIFLGKNSHDLVEQKI